jgi:hypothetical protein
MPLSHHPPCPTQQRRDSAPHPPTPFPGLPQYLTSKTCHLCGQRMEQTSARVFYCGGCKKSHNRYVCGSVRWALGDTDSKLMTMPTAGGEEGGKREEEGEVVSVRVVKGGGWAV